MRELLKIMQDNNEIYDRLVKISKSEICKTCAKCCKELFVVVGEDEIKRIAKFLKIDKKQFIKRFVETKINNEYYLKRPCPFLKGNLCSIYPVRPKACTIFPFRIFEILIIEIGVVSYFPYLLYWDECPLSKELWDKFKVVGEVDFDYISETLAEQVSENVEHYFERQMKSREKLEKKLNIKIEPFRGKVKFLSLKTLRNVGK